MADAADRSAHVVDAALSLHLEDAVRDVFETMVQGGSPRLERSNETSAPVDVELRAVVEFHGMFEGTLSLSCDVAGSRALARGLLMLEESEELEPEQVRDALGECANMVAGSLKTRAFGHAGDVRLSVPRIATGASFDADIARVSCPLAGGALEISVRGAAA